MKTTVGDVELELWAKEAPKACRNFIPLYLIAIANAGKDDNGSRFFFTLNSAPDLQNKHTIFGQVTEETIYDMLELEENDRAVYHPRLIKIIILNNPFSVIIPRIIVQEEFSPGRVILCYEKFCYRNFNLLLFGEEADEDEEESVILNKKFTGKGKSAYDHLTDPKLSSQPAVEPPGPPNKKRKKVCNSDWESDDERYNGSLVTGLGSQLLRYSESEKPKNNRNANCPLDVIPISRYTDSNTQVLCAILARALYRLRERSVTILSRVTAAEERVCPPASSQMRSAKRKIRALAGPRMLTRRIGVQRQRDRDEWWRKRESGIAREVVMGKKKNRCGRGSGWNDGGEGVREIVEIKWRNSRSGVATQLWMDAKINF
ncbi:Peptidyl-prolyl cis-trans isomerase CWC27 like protein [Eufriesea mexicana]|uniref:Spliceosome-associated protein CWC27 homolog n=1 Tax=Eufriesea mexicana TaxID=516756 RepID=A0A310SP39_9HYME|nr:Peptidyl-prolyl cis-trans isomerase CWC27 like protein [Eufriesea mexicana]